MPTDCSVRCTPTILSGIRISWDYHPTFMSTLRFGRSKTNIHWMFCSISGRVPRSFIHLGASSCGFRPFDPGIIKYESQDQEKVIQIEADILVNYEKQTFHIYRYPQKNSLHLQSGRGRKRKLLKFQHQKQV